MGESPLFLAPHALPTMALQLDQIRALADRVAASHQLEVVDLEFSGGARHRTLRVFIEKDAAGRAALLSQPDLPSNVPAEMLSGVTHDDCTVFTSDFGTLLDIEDIVPGAEYTLEVSSPGLERKLSRASDFERFTGGLIKLQTFTAIDANRHFQGRLTAFADDTLTLDLAAIKPRGKARKAAVASTLQIPLANIEKANLIPEI